jgi:hypothetical protein
MTGLLRGRATYLPAYYLCAYKAPYKALHLSRNLYKSALFMQNKPNFRKSQMNVNSVYTVDYEKRTLGERGKNKPNSNPIQSQSNPIKAKTNPIQTQTNPISKQLQSLESAKMAQQINVLKHQNIISEKSNFLYPNRLNSLSQHNPPTGTLFAYSNPRNFLYTDDKQ